MKVDFPKSIFGTYINVLLSNVYINCQIRLPSFQFWLKIIFIHPLKSFSQLLVDVTFVLPQYPDVLIVRYISCCSFFCGSIQPGSYGWHMFNIQVSKGFWAVRWCRLFRGSRINLQKKNQEWFNVKWKYYELHMLVVQPHPQAH